MEKREILNRVYDALLDELPYDTAAIIYQLIQFEIGEEE